MAYESSGTLTTETKSVSQAASPDIVGAVYSLNNQSITVDVVGSPGQAGEEIQSVTLDGSSDFSIQWAGSHTDFRLEITLSTSNDSETPVMNEITIEDQISSSDQDQNPRTTWEIQGAKHDRSGNEYEGGGVISRYGG